MTSLNTVENQEVAYQGFFIRCVMLFLPLLFSMTPVLLHVNGKSLETLSMVGLGLGSIIVLLLVSFQNKIISRLLLGINIYWLMLSVSNLLFGQLQFRYSYSFIALLSVALYTIKYTEYGFLGAYEKSKKSDFLKVLWIIILVTRILFPRSTTYMIIGHIVFFGAMAYLSSLSKKDKMMYFVFAAIFVLIFIVISFALPFAKKNWKLSPFLVQDAALLRNVEDANNLSEKFSEEFGKETDEESLEVSFLNKEYNKKLQEWRKTF
jgi:hypothetical protein